MSLLAFRDRIRALAKNPRHPAARLKLSKFDAASERAYRELIAANGADVQDAVIAALPVAAIDNWFAVFEPSFPSNFAGVATDTASERLSRANKNPPNTIAPSTRDERLQMDSITYSWYSKLSASQKLDFATGALKPPLALHRTEDRTAAVKQEQEPKSEPAAERDSDPVSAFIADAFEKHGLTNE